MIYWIILASLLVVAAAVDIFLLILSRRLRTLTLQLQAAEAEPREPRLILPRIEVDEERRIVAIYFPPFEIDSGEVINLAVPIIKGLGRMVMAIEHPGGSQRWVLDFDSGEVSPFTDVPGPFRAAFE